MRTLLKEVPLKKSNIPFHKNSTGTGIFWTNIFSKRNETCKQKHIIQPKDNYLFECLSIIHLLMEINGRITINNNKYKNNVESNV